MRDRGAPRTCTFCPAIKAAQLTYDCPLHIKRLCWDSNALVLQVGLHQAQSGAPCTSKYPGSQLHVCIQAATLLTSKIVRYIIATSCSKGAKQLNTEACGVKRTVWKLCSRKTSLWTASNRRYHCRCLAVCEASLAIGSKALRGAICCCRSLCKSWRRNRQADWLGSDCCSVIKLLLHSR